MSRALKIAIYHTPAPRRLPSHVSPDKLNLDVQFGDDGFMLKDIPKCGDDERPAASWLSKPPNECSWHTPLLYNRS